MQSVATGIGSAKALPQAGAAGQTAGQDEAGMLSGEDFLQTLAGLNSGGAAESWLSAAAAPGEMQGEVASDDPARDAWLGLAAFVAAGVPEPEPKPAAAAPDAAAGADALDGAADLLARANDGTAARNAATMTVIDEAAAEEVAELLPSAATGDRAASSANPALSGSAALLSSAGATATLGAERPAPVAAASLQQTVHSPLHSPRWAEEIGQRVALMAVSGAQSGSLSLVPEQMGPIEVRIHMNQDTANVWFAASQADTRAALQEALPRLREMFAATGLSLGEAQVSQHTPRREGEAAGSPR
mgnify:CR=1 FL=1